jgi:hypothetical protein
MYATKPKKTLADYLVIGISPALIMLLVGSLSFFLIEVFFRGEAVGSVRWVMFWFVMAVVLVSRIGIEQGKGQAAIYGLALAAATWLYLMRIHPAYFLGMILLGIVWWCAHKLTWDCTLIDDDEDASGGGLLQTAGEIKNFLPPGKTQAKDSSVKAGHKPQPAAPHPPGLWVVYFSLAALPLFGIGQMLLPGGDLESRHVGFAFLFVYVTAALGLLLTTSFLGLRRYLRQRHLQMPATIAFGWIRFGGGVAALVLAAALLLPRPGVNDAWQTLRYQIDHKLRQASEYAARINPHGKGVGRSGNETQKSDSSKKPASESQTQGNPAPTTSGGQDRANQNQDSPPEPAASMLTERARQFYRWFKGLLFLAGAVLVGWWLFRQRDLISQIARSCFTALAQFFRDLFRFGSLRKGMAATVEKQEPKRRLFSAYRNPFLTATPTSWPDEKLVLYSFEALQAWAEEQGIKQRPEQTAREFCLELGDRFPEVTSELNRLSFLYSHAAYGMAMPADSDLEPVKKLWRFFYA